jgi:hypothetical protein
MVTDAQALAVAIRTALERHPERLHLILGSLDYLVESEPSPASLRITIDGIEQIGSER